MRDWITDRVLGKPWYIRLLACIPQLIIELVIMIYGLPIVFWRIMTHPERLDNGWP